MEAPPAARALPPSLPEWRHVDFDAPVWMLRHCRGGTMNPILGFAASDRDDEFRIIYLPIPGGEVHLEGLRWSWQIDSDGKAFPRTAATCERRADGTVLFATKARFDQARGEVWNHINLEGLDGVYIPDSR